MVAGHVTRIRGLDVTRALRIDYLCSTPSLCLAPSFPIRHFLPAHVFFVTSENTVTFEMRVQCVFCKVINGLFNVTLRKFRLSEAQIQATSLHCSLHWSGLPKRSKHPDVLCYRDSLVIDSNVQHNCPISFCLYLTSHIWLQTDISDSEQYRVLIVVCRWQTSYFLVRQAL